MSQPRAPWAVAGSLLFFVVAPGTVAALIPLWMTGWRVEAPFLGVQAVRFAGVLMVGAGVVSLLESFLRFAVRGLGTPAPIVPPTRLVVSGQYRYVRNPMYVSLVVIVVGQGLILGSTGLLQYAAVLGLVFHLWVVLYEEPTLASRFGSSYQAYRQNVRRWWPRAKPWDPQPLP